MWAGILAIFPTLAGWINAILGWFQAKAAAQNAADGSEQKAEGDHQNDGAQSVVDKDSTDAQNAGLDNAEKQLENPIPVVVVKP